MPVIKVQTRTEAFTGAVVGIVVFSIAIVALASCVGHAFSGLTKQDGAAQASAPSAPSAETAVEPVRLAPIEANTLSPYHRNDDPIMWRQYGARGIGQINHLRVLAAKRAARLPACDTIETSDLDDSRSTPPHQPVITVVCKNMTRASYSKADLLDAKG